jgi:hypothetical protein
MQSCVHEPPPLLVQTATHLDNGGPEWSGRGTLCLVGYTFVHPDHSHHVSVGSDTNQLLVNTTHPYDDVANKTERQTLVGTDIFQFYYNMFNRSLPVALFPVTVKSFECRLT